MAKSISRKLQWHATSLWTRGGIRNEVGNTNSFLCSARALTTDAPAAPPLLLKLRSDLKTAMKAKDTNRLNVLRALLAETTNAAKTSNPYKTDMQLVALLRKRAAASRTAAQEFASANRADLQEKEMAQIAVLEDYASGIKTLGDDEITAAIQEVIGKMRTEGKTVNTGSVIKNVVGPGGVLADKPVDNSQVAKLAKGMI